MRKFLAGAFLATALAIPVVASADTKTDLQIQLIQVLTQLITLLEAKIALLQQGQVQAQTETPINMCPPAPILPTRVSCSADWNKIHDSQGCHVGWSCIVYATTVAGKTVQPPIISAVQGPTDLLVNTSGTWKVTATSPVQQKLSYSVIWGDEGANVSQLLDFAAQGVGSYSNSNSFSHTYSTQGSYSLVFFVKDEDGNINKATMSVFVEPPLPPPPPPAPTTTSTSAPTSCTVAGTAYPEGTRLSSADLFLKGSGHSTYPLDRLRPICMYVMPMPGVAYQPALYPYYYTCRAGHWYNDNNVEYCSMLVPPSLQWRYQYFVDIVPDFCRVAVTPDGASCTINGQRYQEGQSYYFSCGLHACVMDPGWLVCRNGTWAPVTGANTCPAGYGWCGFGINGHGCIQLRNGVCPGIL